MNYLRKGFALNMAVLAGLGCGWLFGAENPAEDTAQVDSALVREVESQLDAFADELSQNEHLKHLDKESIFSMLKDYLRGKP